MAYLSRVVLDSNISCPISLCVASSSFLLAGGGLRDSQGLYAAAIIIIVSLSKTSPETFYSVVDHDLQQQFTKPNGPRTLEKLEFAPPKSTLVTDVGASTTAMSRDGELLTINLDRRSDSDTSENSPG